MRGSIACGRWERPRVALGARSPILMRRSVMWACPSASSFALVRAAWRFSSRRDCPATWPRVPFREGSSCCWLPSQGSSGDHPSRPNKTGTRGDDDAPGTLARSRACSWHRVVAGPVSIAHDIALTAQLTPLLCDCQARSLKSNALNAASSSSHAASCPSSVSVPTSLVDARGSACETEKGGEGFPDPIELVMHEDRPRPDLLEQCDVNH